MAKNLPANAEVVRDTDSIPGSRRCPWSRKWQPTPVFLPEKLHGQRSLQVTFHGVTKSQIHTHTQGFLNYLNVKMPSTILEH